MINTNTKKLLLNDQLIRLNLFSSEEVSDWHPVHIARPHQLSDPDHLLAKLCRVDGPSRIGAHGPAYAATGLDQDKHQPELRLFEALFGRDALIVALMTCHKYPRLGMTTIFSLGSLQGTRHNVWSEEEPGRIPHEIRPPDDRIAQQLVTGQKWQFPYYGSIDATPLYVQLICRMAELYGDDLLFLPLPTRDGKVQSVLESAIIALDWIQLRRQSNHIGLVESLRSNPHGIENQVWKDSWDSYHHRDGQLANVHRGVASIEVQGHCHDAYQQLAIVLERVARESRHEQHFGQRAAGYRREADHYQHLIQDHMWAEDERGGYFVLGTDRANNNALRQLQVRSSNPGHLLDSMLFDAPHGMKFDAEAAIVRMLFAPDMLGWAGIRTLSTESIRYRPGAYQNGSVWLWENHKIARGLRHLGYTKLAAELDHRMLRVIKDTHLYPEYVRGDSTAEQSLTRYRLDVYDHQAKRHNRVEQPPQEVQAWTVAAVISSQSPSRKSAITTSAQRLAQRHELERSVLQSIDTLRY